MEETWLRLGLIMIDAAGYEVLDKNRNMVELGESVKNPTSGVGETLKGENL